MPAGSRRDETDSGCAGSIPEGGQKYEGRKESREQNFLICSGRKRDY